MKETPTQQQASSEEGPTLSEHKIERVGHPRGLIALRVRHPPFAFFIAGVHIEKGAPRVVNPPPTGEELGAGLWISLPRLVADWY